jgi:hypothetical protein
MNELSSIKLKLSKTTNVLLSIAGVVGAVTIIAGGYTWYLNTIWKPTVKVIEVDFENGKAKLEFRGKTIDLEGDAVYWLRADWGIKFGNIVSSGKSKYDRLELLKNKMVVEYIQKGQ